MEEITTCAANMESANILSRYKPMKPAYHKTKESFAGMAQTTMQQKRQLLC
jgi:hypothetical protein